MKRADAFLRRAYAFSGGTFLAVLQFGFFLLLERGLSSAWIAYAAVTLSWMGGFLLGLFLRPRGRTLERAMLPASLAAYYVVRLCLQRFPFDARFLPFYALCVFGAGAYAGWFFRSSFRMMGRAGVLLLWENNGFVSGLLASFFLFATRGDAFLAAGVAAFGAVPAVLRELVSRRDAGAVPRSLESRS